jgi:phage replication O-like protein O
MKSPQKENGFTPIANEILDQLIKTRLTDYEYRVLWAIIRRTYGYHKTKSHISASLISVMTNIRREHVWRTLKGLEKQGLIYRDHRYKGINVWGFQKDYDKWSASAQRGTKLVPNGAPPLVPTQAPIKDIDKETSKDTITKVIEKTPEFGNKDINSLIRIFENHNLKITTKQKLNRYAANRLIKKYGLSKITRLAEYSLSITEKRYAPQVTNILDLEEKLPKIILYWKKHSQSKSITI